MLPLSEITRFHSLALNATPGPLLPAFLGSSSDPKTAATSREEIVAAFVNAMIGSDGDGKTFHGVIQRCEPLGDLPGGDVPVFWVGCGNQAQRDTDFLVEARDMVLKLIDENTVLRSKLRNKASALPGMNQ